MIQRNISGDVKAITENMQVIRAKFQPLLDSGQHDEDIRKLIEVIPQMLDNVEDMVHQLEKAFQILRDSTQSESPDSL